MINLVPFKAVRPPRDKAHLVASRSYVSYTPAALNRKLSENPYSFIHIINPEFSTGEKPKKNSRERFEKVRDQYLSFIKERNLLNDNEKAFYLYEQSSPWASFIGFIGGVSTIDYRKGLIKKHEQTLTKREKMFCEYLDVCGFNAEPVLLTYPEHISAIDAFKASKRLERPEYEFTTTDKTTHRMWIISDEEDIERIKIAFKKVDALYIADGHHRMASSALLAEKKAAENPDHTGLEDYNYTMALVMPGETLRISPFHRLIGKGMEIEDDQLLDSIRLKFTIKKVSSEFLPHSKRQFGLRLKSGWYVLSLKKFEGDESALSHLDSVILTATILEPILGITDQKTDKRIQFIPGNLSLAPYESSIERGNAKALFTLCEVTAEELYAISDEASTMPPKSTFIEPKLRSGLTIMNLK
ncbi:DUF1015 domain-containing protein [Cryomorphaceae bacterium 1068]|nr:DUF1015 domain-containing protein [Cryomorphaceae bacterium 1068]